MSLVAILVEDRLRERVEELVKQVGFTVLNDCDSRTLTDAVRSHPDPDVALVVTEAWHPDWFAPLDGHEIRYWLVEVGTPRGPALVEPVRRPHRHLLTLDESSAAYLSQLLDDWRDRARVRVDCFNFAFRDGLPAEADWVLDTRFLDSPYWIPELRGRRGDDPEVRHQVMAQPGAERLVAGFLDVLQELLPLYRSQRRSVLRVAVGCTGGQHRSVAVATEIAERISHSGAATGRLLERPPHHLPQTLD